MAIRFLCPLCGQPVEIDDPWAGKLVACPFCRKTVTAPAESTLALEAAVPTAAPFGPVAGGPAYPAAPYPADMPAVVESRNTAALVALVASVVSAASLLAAMIVMGINLSEVLGGDPTGMTQAEVNRTVQKYMMEQPTPPVWMVVVMLLMLLSAAGWLTAVICGVMGLGRRRRRGLAVAALSIAGAQTVLACFSTVISLTR